ncbi:MAG: DsrE family protein [Halarchaeum sp.]
MGDPTRRRVLAGAGPAAVAALAGCSAGRDADATSESTEPTDETTENTDQNPMSTVFHYSDESAQSHAVANVTNLLADDTVDLGTVTLVANGAGLALLTTDSNEADAVERLADDGVRFRACRNTMDAKNYAESDLLSGVEPVPSGVGELAKRQAAGDAYIKTP